MSDLQLLLLLVTATVASTFEKQKEKGGYRTVVEKGGYRHD